jgi:hypothetical protein
MYCTVRYVVNVYKHVCALAVEIHAKKWWEGSIKIKCVYGTVRI